MKKILIMLLLVSVGLFFFTCGPTPPADPTFDPEAGEVEDGTEVAISTATEGAKIFYTLDGTDPATQPGTSTYEYDDANKPVINRADAPVTIRALAYLTDGDVASQIVEAVYTVAPREWMLEVTIDGDGTVEVTDDGETLTGTGPWSIVEGSEVVLTATATGTNGLFLGWSGDISSGDNPYTIASMEEDYAVTASFSSFDPATESLLIVDVVPGNIWGDTSGYEFVMDTDGDMVPNPGEFAFTGWTDTDIQSLYNTYNDYTPIPTAFPPASGDDIPLSTFTITPNTYDIGILNPFVPTGWDGSAFTDPPTAGSTSANPTYVAGGLDNGAIDAFQMVAGGTYVVYITGNQTAGETITILDSLDPKIKVSYEGTELSNDAATVQDLGTVVGTFVVTVENLGWQPLDISDVTFTDITGLTMTPVTTPVMLNPGETLDLEFEATQDIADSGVVSISSNDTDNTPFEFKFTVALPTPVTLPESFEGADWDNLTTGNYFIVENDGGFLTFDTVEAYDGLQSLKFVGPVGGDSEFASITFRLDTVTGEALSFKFKGVSGSSSDGYSTVEVYDADTNTQIGTTIDTGQVSGDWESWAADDFTADESKYFRIEFSQTSYASDMEVYLDFLDQAVKAPAALVRYGDDPIADDNGTPVPYNFGTVTNASPNSYNLEIANVGTSDLQLTDQGTSEFVTVTNTGDAFFTITTQPNYVDPLVPGDSLSFTVQFDPTVAGTPPVGDISASFLIQTNETDTDYTFDLEVTAEDPTPKSRLYYTGTDPEVELPDDDTQFYTLGQVPNYTDNEFVFRFENYGTGDITIANPRIASSDVNFDEGSDAFGVNSLPVDGSETFSIKILSDGLTAGTYTTVITINTTNDQNPPFEFGLSVDVLDVTAALIGTGTEVGQHLPIEPFYGYTYSQVIYLQSEIDNTGNIVSIEYDYTGGAWDSTGDWVVYMGHTAKTEFANDTDWVAIGDLTEVFNGTVTAPDGGGPVTITLDTPFAYNNTDNLVIAVDENTPGYDGSSDDFYCSSVTNNRAIYQYSDGTNYDPANPPQGDISAYIANILIAFN